MRSPKYGNGKKFFCLIVVVLLLFYSQNASAVAVGWVKVVDNSSAGYSETGNAWVSYTWGDAVNGSYRYLSHKGHKVVRKGTATWVMKVPTSGTYQVAIHYRPTENRSYDADFHVYDGKGTIHKFSVNQSYHGPLKSTGWLTLGSYTWNAGQTAKIVLDGTDDEQSDESDAVRWKLVKRASGGAVGAPIPVYKQMLLDKSTPGTPPPVIEVNLVGTWKETGGYDDCPSQKTDLVTVIAYVGDEYKIAKSGQVQEPHPDCSSTPSPLRTWEKRVPQPQSFTKSEFTALMQIVFTNAVVTTTYYSNNKIIYRTDHPDKGEQTRTLFRQ